MTQYFEAAHGQAFGGFPLTAWDRLDAAAPDFGQKGAGEQGQRSGCCQPGRHVDTEQGDTEEYDEQLHQQRRALEQLDIAARQQSRSLQRGDTRKEDQQAGHATANEGHQRQQQRPLQTDQQVAQYVP
ncbi:hypothetical protein D9M68_824300 [compost metagenome]